MAHFQVERLRRLPQQAGEVWQGGLLRLPLWDDQAEGGPRRLWAAIWMNPGRETIHMSRPQPAGPADYEMAQDALVEMAVKPKLAGYRPGRLAVNDAGLAEYLAKSLGEIGIEVRHEPRLEILQKGLAEMPGLQPAVTIEGMLSVKGVTVERIRSFAEAAVEYHRAEPWLRQNDSDLVRVAAPKAPKGFECAVVMGEGRSIYGLALFNSVSQYQSMMKAGPGYFRSHGAWSVTFDSIMDLPIVDADLWEDEHLPMTGEHACPMVYYQGAKGQTKRPSASQLAYLEGLLRAIARTSEEEMDTGRWSKTVETFDGPVEYQLTMPRLLEPVLLPRTTRQVERLDWPTGLEEVRELAERIHRQNPSLDEQEVLQQALAESVADWEPRDESDVDEPLTAGEQADYLANLAGEQLAHRMRVRLARMALQLDADCVEAYVQLGLAAPDAEQMLEYCRQGVEAGRRALTPKQVRSPGIGLAASQRESYLFAWCGVVGALAQLERFEEAVEEGLELLRTDRQDEANVRYQLLLCLLVLGRDEEAEEVWRLFSNEDHPVWLYGRALLTFRREGASAEAANRLLEAMQADETLAAMLAGEEMTDEEEPEEMPAEGYSLTPKDMEDMEDQPALQEMQEQLEDMAKYVAQGMDDGLDVLGPPDEDEDDEVGGAAEMLLDRAWSATPDAIPWLQRELALYRQTQEQDDHE